MMELAKMSVDKITVTVSMDEDCYVIDIDEDSSSAIMIFRNGNLFTEE
jgi:hypothetical protein